MPPQKDQLVRPVKDDPAQDMVQGVAKGATHLAKETAEGFKDFFGKPIEGAKKDGIAGLARGMKDGITGGLTHQAAAWQGMAHHVGDGLGGTLESIGIHGIGLQEFQHFQRMRTW
eukprot:CAMPEP_0169280786 /NCGR_PEP_ID=MMETSP1016-20121227/55823_1 /TAXON_ID=342587 /ORGANISM="Karlodinium micrum, Strain CCMP2283" /LENGTH=114 /DNA_ID=CAMNT_0009369195 /DNA_START=266 /DNA_END=607 /DNA_ORIENTATION=-